jgi:uncharacterized membrane protein YdjX (TVP38/TMEM64 family)
VRAIEGRTWLRAGLLLLVLVAGTVVALAVDRPSVSTLRDRLAGAGATGDVLLAVGSGIALLAPVPRTALAVLTGLVLGFGPGLVVAFAGGMLGGLGAFALSRWLGRGAATRLAGPRLQRIDDVVAERPFVSVLTARVVPVLPFTPLSYAAGLTRMRWTPYLAATAVGLVPGTVVQVGLGASAPFVVQQATALTVVPVVAAVVAVAVGVLVWRKRAAA